MVNAMGRLESFPYQGQWHYIRIVGDKWFYLQGGCEGEAKDMSKSERDDIGNIVDHYNDNRLSYFLAHGGGKDFLNDYENGICMLIAPTRTGKSCHGMAWTLLRTLNCDPDWHCFEHHGLVCPEYRGPRKQVISSYSWGNVEEIYQELLKWTPRKLLGQYALDWGKYPGETAKAKIVSFNGKSTRLKLTDGNEFIFLCDGQAQGAWEGKRWDDGFFDEQRQREKFIGFLRGQGNTQGLVQSCFCLTGHVLPDRPDTGAAGWIKNELWDDEYTFGKTIGRYTISMQDVPDAVLSPTRKGELREQWVDAPTRNKDEETLRKAEARYHGRWETGSGLVLDCFDPQHHVIPNVVDWKNELFNDATKYRGMDHGLGRPGTCSWGMMFPWGDLLIYREYYEPGRSVPYHARKIVEMSRNRTQKAAGYTDGSIGEAFDTYDEIFDGETYHSSVMDGRSFASPAQESDRTLGQLYQDWGLSCSPARGYRNEKIVPQMKTWFNTDPERVHIMHELYTRGAVKEDIYQSWLEERKGKIRNGARIYFVSDLKMHFKEFRMWAKHPETGLPIGKFDHIAGGALKYLIAEQPRYWGNLWDEPVDTLRVVQGDPLDHANRKKPQGGYKFCSY